jgi:hypothetical protein
VANAASDESGSGSQSNLVFFMQSHLNVWTLPLAYTFPGQIALETGSNSRRIALGFTCGFSLQNAVKPRTKIIGCGFAESQSSLLQRPINSTQH